MSDSALVRKLSLMALAEDEAITNEAPRLGVDPNAAGPPTDYGDRKYDVLHALMAWNAFTLTLAILARRSDLHHEALTWLLREHADEVDARNLLRRLEQTEREHS